MSLRGAAPPRFLARYRDEIEDALRTAIGDEISPLAAAARYVMGWESAEGRSAAPGGKRIRPALCLFAAEALGGTVHEAMPGAVAVELVHNFSLVHDEIQDRDAQRHHRPTVWALLGEAQAINVGDFLYTRAIRCLSTGADQPGRRLAALAILNDAIERMIQGQWRDIAFESDQYVAERDYLEMVAGKTGALIGAPLAIGAVLAGAPASTADVLRQWGVTVGLAFQARDDYLGIWGHPDHTGKSNVNDIARRKKTLPIVQGLGRPGTGAVIRDAYLSAEPSAEQIARVVAALEMSFIHVRTAEYASRYAAEADALLDRIDIPETRRGQFRELASYFAERDA